MLNTQTIDKLKRLGLHAMSNAWETQHGQANVSDLTFDERLGLLVDAEYFARESKRLTRLLREAKLKIGQACLENVDYSPKREIDKAAIRQLGACIWVQEHQSILVTGMTGVGKTYLACALAQQACRNGYRALYQRASRLFQDLALARADGSYGKLLARIARADVLLIDDWALSPARESDRHDLLEIIEDRYGQQIDHHHQPIAAIEVARVPRRSHRRRRHPGPPPPQRSSDRAKGALSPKGGGARRSLKQTTQHRRSAPNVITGRAARDGPDVLRTMAGIRTLYYRIDDPCHLRDLSAGHEQRHGSKQMRMSRDHPLGKAQRTQLPCELTS